MYEYEYRPLLFILLGEITLFLFFLVLFFYKRILFFFRMQKSEKRKEKITTFLIECLKSEAFSNHTKVPKEFKHRKDLLVTLETFNLRFKGSSWNSLKALLVNKWLLPKARVFAKSFFWKRRSFAARCFSLVPLQRDESILISLMDDPHFLVQSNASSALVFLESPSGIKKIVQKMSQHSGFTSCFFQDALQKGSIKVIAILVELASIQSIHLACLKALSGQSLGIPLLFLEKDLESKDLEIRLLAMELLSHNPTRNAVSKLIRCSKDPDERMRKQAVITLSSFGTQESVKRLQEVLLKDDNLKIRLEAAKSLQKLGRMDLLEEQSSQNKEVSQMLAYVLQFGSL